MALRRLVDPNAGLPRMMQPQPQEGEWHYGGWLTPMSPSTTRARLAVLAAFCIHGAVFSSWVPLIPTVQQTLGLTPGELVGIALLGSAIGSLVAMPFVGPLIGRFGSRSVFAVSGLGYCLALPLPVIAPNLPALFLALTVFGVFQGVSDVAMNAHGVLVESGYRRPLMSSFHGVWSLGSLGAATAGGVLAALGTAPLARAFVPAAILAAAMALAARAMLPSEGAAHAAGPAFVRLPRQLVVLGVVAFCALIAEGAIGDWSAVYLRRSLDASPGLAAAGYVVFTLCMTIARLIGDWVTARFDAVLLVRLGGGVLAGGLGAALLAGHTAATLVGFALVGLALANVLPIVYSAAGRTSGRGAGSSLAAVSSTGYLGYLVDPPAIGLTADHRTLRGALGIAAALGLIMVALAPAVRPVPTEPARQDGRGDGPQPGTASDGY